MFFSSLQKQVGKNLKPRRPIAKENRQFEYFQSRLQRSTIAAQISTSYEADCPQQYRNRYSSGARAISKMQARKNRATTDCKEGEANNLTKSPIGHLQLNFFNYSFQKQIASQYLILSPNSKVIVC